MSNNYTDSLLQSMSIIAEQAVKNADYDRTVQATIISCVDPTIGKYKVNYQNGSWYAFSSNTNTTYVKGANVYVLIPGGDMNNTKTILGTTKQLGINYISTVEDIERYALNGNSITSGKAGKIFELCSYKTNTVTLYPGNSQFSIDINSANTYLKKSSHLVVSALVKTNLPFEQRYNGNYGLNFYLVFKTATEGDTKEEVTRKYTFDVDNMEGNPYVLPNGLNQKAFFQIDGTNFVKISKIEMFVNDFPNQDPEAPNDEHPNDIFLSNISLYGADVLSQQELDSVALVLNAPKGYIFNKNDNKEATRTINAQVRVQGKAIDNNSQKLAYYWFVQDCTITSNNLFYCKYGGQGWKCLNPYKVIKTIKDKDEKGNTIERPVTYSFNAGPATYSIKKDNVKIKQKKYKCVVVYDNTVISKQFTIINTDANYTIAIESDMGTEFVKDIGYPTLTCKVTGNNSNLEYIWSETTNTGTVNFLQNQNGGKEYESYKKLQGEYNTLKNGFNNHTKLKNAYYDESNKITNISRYNNLAKILKEQDKKQYVVDNKIIHLNVKNITNFSIFTCAVKDEDHGVIGTASITIVNKATSTGGYSVIINDGSQVFNYDENGVSPCSRTQSEPLSIPALSFTLYDMNGREVDKDNINSDNVEWIIPITNTMLEVSGGTVNTDQVTKTVKGKTLTYSIAQRYSINKTNNDIQLKIKYDNRTVSNKTNFTFTKQGQLGTNGTGFVLRIIPCIEKGEGSSKTINEITEYPMVTITNSKKVILNFNYLKYQLWNNGEQLTETPTNVNWSILQNRGDTSCLSVVNKGGNISCMGFTKQILYTYSPLTTLYSSINNTNAIANIIKLTVTYQKKTYYATLPIISVYQISNTNYSASLVKNTGFRYVVYSEDGRFPQYDNHQPFTIKVTEKLTNGLNEDISLFPKIFEYVRKDNGEIEIENGKEKTKNGYSFNYLGGHLTTDNSKYLTGTNNNYSKGKNTKYVKPIDEYDGFNVKNAVCCTVRINDVKQLFIHIPIHFMLNKFGHAALNKWDGNSIEISNEEGVILSPQVGAGKKDDSSNTFTGILIGDVKKGNDEPKTGLFGYGNGIQTIFLDANTGIAEFGKTGSGQIKIEPGDNNKTHATITGGNYTYNKTGGKGMQIDLSEPSIKFGSTNFEVNSDGHLTAKGGGSIAGWDIGDYALTKGLVGMSSDNQKIENGKRVYDKNEKPVIDNDRIAFWAGNATRTSAPFRVNFKGDLVANTATLGSGNKKIALGKDSSGEYSAIYSNSKNSLSSTNSGFYLGTDGISLGSNFSVNQSGELTAKKGYIGSSISNGFTIADQAIYNNKQHFTGLNDNNKTSNGIFLGKDGISLGPYDTKSKKSPFQVDYKGNLYAELGTIAGWTISNSALRNSNASDTFQENGQVKHEKDGIYIGNAGIRMGSNFHITSNGKLWCQSGNIGPWKIGASGLFYTAQKPTESNISLTPTSFTIGNLTITNAGAISNNKGTNGTWSVTSDGVATFSNIKITGKNSEMSNGTINGKTSMTGGSITPGSVGCGSYKNMDKWCEGTFDTLWATNFTAKNINTLFQKATLSAQGLTATGTITATKLHINKTGKNLIQIGDSSYGKSGSQLGLSFNNGIYTGPDTTFTLIADKLYDSEGQNSYTASDFASADHTHAGYAKSDDFGKTNGYILTNPNVSVKITGTDSTGGAISATGTISISLSQQRKFYREADN